MSHATEFKYIKTIMSDQIQITHNYERNPKKNIVHYFFDIIA